MAKNKLSSEDKERELIMYRDLVIATLDYHIELFGLNTKSKESDFKNYYNNLKIVTEENFQKGRLTRLKQWFRDLTEMQIESVDLKFNNYIKDKTQYDIDIFKSYFERIEKVIEKGKITSDNQYYDINMMVDHLCQTQPVDKSKIDILNKLLLDYHQHKEKKMQKKIS